MTIVYNYLLTAFHNLFKKLSTRHEYSSISINAKQDQINLVIGYQENQLNWKERPSDQFNSS